MTNPIAVKGQTQVTTHELHVRRPTSWDNVMYRLKPGRRNKAPLTAILSKLKVKKATDPMHSWLLKRTPILEFSLQGDGVYIDSGLTSVYESGGVASNVVYVQVTSTDANYIRLGQMFLLRCSTDLAVDTVCRIVSLSDTVVGLQLMEDDDNSAEHDLSDANYLLNIGDTNAEGAVMPEAIARKPERIWNYTQIFRTAISMTRTEMQTTLRGPNERNERRLDALEAHMIKMEKAFLFGERDEWTGTNGNQERSTRGYIKMLKETAPNNYYDYKAENSGITWATGGADAIDEVLEFIYRQGGSDTRLGYCGSGALLGIQKLVAANTTMTIQPGVNKFGYNVNKWITAFGNIDLILHPMFSMRVTEQNSIFIVDPEAIGKISLQPTMWKPDDRMTKGGYQARDGIYEEYLTEEGAFMAYADTCAYITNVGQDG